MIYYNSNTINDWNFGDDNIAKVYYGVTSGSTSRLPSGYTEVEYIESPRKSEYPYIDTGFMPNQNTRVIADFQYTDTNTHPRCFGCGVWNSVGYIFNAENGISSNGEWKWKFGANGNTWLETNVVPNFNRHTVEINNGNLYLDNTLIGSTTVTTFQLTDNIGLFGFIQNGSLGGTNAGEYMTGKFYSFKIYDNGTLVRDFVPCKRDNDNVYGMYDIVGGSFYTSPNNYLFSGGSAVTPSSSTTVGNIVYQKLTPPTPPTFGFVSYGSNGNVLASGNCDSLSSGVVSRSVITNNGDISINAIYAVEFGSCVTTIADNTFKSDGGNVVVSSVTFDQHSQLTTIGNRVFKDAKNITSITLPNSLITLGDYAFSYTDNIVGAFTIPSGVTNIGTYCFEGLSKVTSFVIEATTPPTLGNTPFIGTSCPIYVPAASVDTYKAASGWSDYASRIQAIQT